MRNETCNRRGNATSNQGKKDREMPFSGQDSKNHAVAKYQLPTILQLNIEGLTKSKVEVIERLAIKNKVLVILLRETHCDRSENLSIHNFTLAGVT